MNTVAKLEKIEAGRYEYRGVKIFKYDYQGFSYKFSSRTDTYYRTDATYPVALKDIAAKIDNDIDVNKNVVDHAGYMVKDTRTKVGA
jgi:hypothetical protein